MCGGKKKSCYDWGTFHFFLYEFGAETCTARSGMLQIGGVQSFRAGGSVFSEKIQGGEVFAWVRHRLTYSI